MKKTLSIIFLSVTLVSMLVFPIKAASVTETEKNGQCVYVYEIYDNEWAKIIHADWPAAKEIGKTLEIPESLGGYPVRVIGERAFADDYDPYDDGSHPIKNKYDEWVIPDTVTEIESYAFSKNPWFTKITIPGSVKEIGVSAFDECWNLEQVEINKGVSVIDDYAFSSTNLKSVTIPSSVQYMGEYAFGYNSLLNEVKFEDGIKTIGDSSFCCDSNLQKVTFPDSLKNIGKQAFKKCKKLDNIVLPENLRYIGDEAFSGSIGLKSLCLSHHIEHYGRKAFFNCDSLLEIKFDGSIYFYKPYVGEKCFGCFSHKVEKKPVILLNSAVEKIVSRANENNVECIVKIPGNETEENTVSSGTISAGSTLRVICDEEISLKSQDPKTVKVDKDGHINGLQYSYHNYIEITATTASGKEYHLLYEVSNSPSLRKKTSYGYYKNVNSVTVKKGKTADLKLTGKVSSIPNKYTSTKYAKITSKKNASTIKIRGIKKGSSTLKIKVNGVYTIKLRVKVV